MHSLTNRSQAVIVISLLAAVMPGCSSELGSESAAEDSSSEDSGDMTDTSGDGDGDGNGCSEWTSQFGGAGNNGAYAVAIDAAGNVYVTGYTHDPLDAMPGAGGSDVFLAKYDASGDPQWTRQFGSPQDDSGYSLATDAEGNVYIAGQTDGALDGQSSAGDTDLFIAKYDGDGTMLWLEQSGTATLDSVRSVATDGAGNVFVTGTTGVPLDGVSGGDGFVSKYDGAGNVLWARQFGITESSSGAAATDQLGNVYVGGSAAGSLDGEDAGGLDAIVLKYDALGDEQWTRQFGSDGVDYTQGLAIDGAGDVYAVGFADGSLDGENHVGYWDAFVRKYDSSGVEQWTQQFGTAGLDWARAVAIDDGGRVYVVGYTEASLEGQPHLGGNDLFVRRYAADGVEQWTRQWGTVESDRALGVATGPSGITIVGETSGALDGQAALGNRDAVVIRLCDE